MQAVRRKVPDARAIGIQTPGRYAGERLRADGHEKYRIEQCDSPLAARVALIDEEPGVTMTVLVTGLSESELGEDVMVRLAKRRLYHRHLADRQGTVPGPDGRSPPPVTRLDRRAVA